MDTPPKTSFTYPLTEDQQILLAEVLHTGNYRPIVVPYAQVSSGNRYMQDYHLSKR